MGRAPCCEKVGLKRGRWTDEEDAILSKYVQANGEGSWRSLPKNAGLLRCGKSCRLRWINYLKSELKRGNITKDEEEIIIKMHATLGNRWSLIASHLPGRTDNEIKNYWNTHLSRKIQSFRSPGNEELPVPLVMEYSAKVNKRKGGRTSRAAMQKNRSTRLIPNKLVINIPKVALENPQDSRGSSNGNGGPVLMPSTPTLEKEALSKAVSWQEDSLSEIMLEPCGIDDDLGNNSNVVATWPYEERVLPGELLLQNDAVKLATCEGLDEEGMFWLDDLIMREEAMMDPVGDMNLGEKGERENGGGPRISDGEERGEGGTSTKMSISEGVESVNNIMDANGEHYSSSTNSYIGEGSNWEWDFDWDWDQPLAQGHELMGDEEQEEEKMVGWLWDHSGEAAGDGSKMGGGEVVSSEKKDAMVAWLLS